MCFLSAKSITIFTILIIEIYHIAGNKIVDSSQQIVKGLDENLRKKIHMSCPSLVRSNNWEIEKFFGNWSGVELYVHKAHRNDSFSDTCMRIYIAEVNEQNEEMTYGRPVDPFNFRLALRHLKVVIYTNGINSDEYFTTFNNTNQMIWHGSKMRMQIIKFDGKQMMMTVCAMEKGEVYTILLNRYDENGNEYQVDSTSLNRLILQGRNLKIQSKFKLQTDCSKLENFGDRVRSSFVIVLVTLAIYLMDFVV